MTYIITILFVYGVYHVTHKFADFFHIDIDKRYEKAPLWLKFIMKPTVYCGPCMSSVWGSFCYFILLGQTDWRTWILTIVICVGVITYLNNRD